MTYSVGNSEVANYANTSSGQVTNVAADNGLGGACLLYTSDAADE